MAPQGLREVLRELRAQCPLSCRDVCLVPRGGHRRASSTGAGASTSTQHRATPRWTMHGLIWSGPGLAGPVPSRPVPSGPVPSGPVRSGPDPSGLVWSALVRVWSGLALSGLVWSGLVWCPTPLGMEGRLAHSRSQGGKGLRKPSLRQHLP